MHFRGGGCVVVVEIWKCYSWVLRTQDSTSSPRAGIKLHHPRPYCVLYSLLDYCTTYGSRKISSKNKRSCDFLQTTRVAMYLTINSGKKKPRSQRVRAAPLILIVSAFDHWSSLIIGADIVENSRPPNVERRKHLGDVSVG